MSKLLIYIPAYNEEETIYQVIKSIPLKINGIEEIVIIVVNDGSTDKTEKIALSTNTIVLNHRYNKGVGAAFQTAVEYALQIKTDFLISIDADGQFDVNQIEELLNPIINNVSDFCIGNRFYRKIPLKMPKIKYWGNMQVNKIISFVSKTKIYDASCGFRAYSRECLLNLNLNGNFTYTHETILDLINKGFKVCQLPINVKYFDNRTSRVADNILNYAFKTSKIIIKYLKDYAPFYFFISIALFIFSLALILSGFVFYHWINSGSITPYKSLGIFSLALLGMSLIVATLALIADMLGRIRQNQEKILYQIGRASCRERV